MPPCLVLKFPSFIKEALTTSIFFDVYHASKFVRPKSPDFAELTDVFVTIVKF